MALITIGAYAFPSPTGYNATTKSIVAGGMNLEGKFIGSLVKDDIHVLSMEWGFIIATDWSAILANFKNASGGFYSQDVTFLDQDTNTYITREMSISDRNSNLIGINVDGVMGYNGATLALSEE